MASCDHLARWLEHKPPLHPNTQGCEECLQSGDAWVHLRVCLLCGHVGCCDSSKNKHATAHFHATSHPLVQSFEPGETWVWCYADQSFAALARKLY